MKELRTWTSWVWVRFERRSALKSLKKNQASKQSMRKNNEHKRMVNKTKAYSHNYFIFRWKMNSKILNFYSQRTSTSFLAWFIRCFCCYYFFRELISSPHSSFKKHDTTNEKFDVRVHIRNCLSLVSFFCCWCLSEKYKK